MHEESLFQIIFAYKPMCKLSLLSDRSITYQYCPAMREVSFFLRSAVLLGGMIIFPVNSLMSQHTSRDNYTGFWETESSWNPSWPSPQNNISGYDINIYGYISTKNSISFSGSQANITVYDTLIVNGDLVMDNNSSLKITDGGILIVRGILKIENQGIIAANSYLIVGGNFIKSGSSNQGSFTSDDNPVKVFIGGTLDPPSLTNNTDYPVLNCVSPVTQRYKNTGCSYGNMADLAGEGAVWDFYQDTCGSVTATSNSPVCEGSSITLSATTKGIAYLWSGPGGFSNTLQNPVILNAGTSMTGTYFVKVVFPGGCTASDSVIVTVNPIPAVIITNSPNAMCLNDKKPLTGYPEGGTFTVNSGPGVITGNVLSASQTGDINITYTYTGSCTNTATQTVHFFDMPVASPGRDQVLKDLFETQMKASLASYEVGEWSKVSGAGQISDIHSPTSAITELEIGESVFRWKVVLGSCESTAEVKITVLDLFIPSVITPNGDGKNDYFTVYSLNGRSELIILNRWGNIEYSNRDYKNDWDGKNDKGADLKEDTYFFILKFEDGFIKKGSVVITR
jgi:gliding motility-associated-like protein